MGRGIVVLLYTSVSRLFEDDGLTSVIHCETAPTHFTGVTPDCIPVGIY
jgi:hypothetical protein